MLSICMSSDDQQTEEASRSSRSKKSLGAALNDLSNCADDFQTELDQLNAAIDELQESTEQLTSLKQAESDSLATLADNLSTPSPAGASTTSTSVAPVADD